ncbi:MAG: hypothetical protein JSW51_05510, partial [Gemmatimonadota bacterium]
MSGTKTMQRLLLVDWIVAGYNLVFGLIWLSQVARVSFALVLALAHLVGLLLPWLLARAPADMSEPMKTLREIYPLLFLAVFWPELDILRPVLALESGDAPVAAIDLFIFRVPLHDIWMPNMAA